MQNDLVFKTSVAKRVLGWLMFLGAGAAMVALSLAFYKQRDTQTTADLWSAVAIYLFLIGFMVAGIASQYIRWRVDGETIVFHHFFRSKTFRVADLAGFGQLTIVVLVFPFLHVLLYDHDLKFVARLPIAIKDWPRAEAWLATRLRYVVNDGSPILTKPRFADTPKP